MGDRALIVIDVQNDYFPGGKCELHGIEASAANAARVLADARAKEDFIVHVHHEFEGDDAPFFAPGTEGAEIHPSMTPREGEATVLKHEVNAFLGTNLKELLDGQGVTDVTIVGDMSHMCIDAAARAASDHGFAVTVIEDACSSCDLEFNGEVIAAPDVHKAYMSALGFAYGEIKTTDDYLS